MTYTIKSSCLKDTFTVPNIIADKHLRLASGDQIKVLLFALRKSPVSITADEAAKFLKLDISDVDDCLQYWVLTGILNEGDEINKAPAEPVKYVPKASNENVARTHIEQNVPIEFSKPSSAEIAERVSESPKIANLFREIQQKLGKTIGYEGQCTFIMLHDYYGLSPEVLFMMVDYCVSIGKTGYSYIAAVGKSWSEQEVDTIEKAADKIASLNSVEKFWKTFSAETGINTPRPTAKQIAYIETWTNELKMDYSLIVKAYEDMAEHTGKLSFSYMNKILESWHSKGFKTITDIENFEKSRTNSNTLLKSGNSQTPSYSIEEYRRKSDTKTLKYERKSK
jgi:DnaD/phage-associated family protein